MCHLGSEDMEITQRHLKSYENACESLGKQLAYRPPESHLTVIYIVNPETYMSSSLDMCQCFQKLQEAYKNERRQKNSPYRFILQLVPIAHILKKSAFGGYRAQGMKDIAFSVYAKCPKILHTKVYYTKKKEEH